MRFFQKAIRRAKLDVAYSQGYSPHQLMSFASPLGVGITSDGEYIDVNFNSLPDKPLEELVTYLNQYMTDEIFVTHMEIMPDYFKNSMSLLCACDYMIVEKEEGIFPEDYETLWTSYLEQEEIKVIKKTKKSEKEVDIKPYILGSGLTLEEFSAVTGQDYGQIHCQFQGRSLFVKLTSGSDINIKPDLILTSFFDYCQRELKPYACQIHRLQMYFNPIKVPKE